MVGLVLLLVTLPEKLPVLLNLVVEGLANERKEVCEFLSALVIRRFVSFYLGVLYLGAY